MLPRPEAVSMKAREQWVLVDFLRIQKWAQKHKSWSLYKCWKDGPLRGDPDWRCGCSGFSLGLYGKIRGFEEPETAYQTGFCTRKTGCFAPGLYGKPRRSASHQFEAGSPQLVGEARRCTRLTSASARTGRGPQCTPRWTVVVCGVCSHVQVPSPVRQGRPAAPTRCRSDL